MKSFIQPLYHVYRAVLKHPKYRWIAILASLLYLASPVDLVADIIPFFGWIDDGMIATVLIAEVSQLLLENRKKQSEPSDTESSEPISA